MTNENLEDLINALNRGEKKDLVFRTKLSGSVEYARVWSGEPAGNICNESSHPFYFLVGEDGTIIGAVLDMYSDLHVFVKEEMRGQGHLSRALNAVILPHIHGRSPNRKQQDLTFEDPEVARRYAKHWGFTMTGEKSATKDLTAVVATNPAAFEGRALTKNEFCSIRGRIDKARLQLTMIQEQLNMSCGSAPQILDAFITDIGSLDDDILNHIENQQGDLVS